ncbi:MAG: hypothetical protein RL701_4351 [Pseudomonadota bacterium]|jgi:hemerythrin superfamily protein
MEATKLLSRQHRKVEALLRKLSGKHPDAGTLLPELANQLAAHMAIEQDVFYPAVNAIKPDLVLEAYEEHSLAEFALKRLLATDVDDDAFHARVIALKELIEHHVKEEEEELFPKVEKALGEEHLRELGRHMRVQFDEVVSDGFEATVPKGFGKTSADVSKKELRASQHKAKARAA